MRTTIDLPDDLHRQAQAIARDTSGLAHLHADVPVLISANGAA